MRLLGEQSAQRHSFGIKLTSLGFIAQTDFVRPLNNQKYLVFTPTGLLGQHLLITIERTREKDQGLSAQAGAPASSLSACSAARLQFFQRGAGCVGDMNCVSKFC